MYTARDVANVIEAIAPLDSGVPNDALGFLYGDPDAAVKGVACMWNIHSRSISAAAQEGLNMLICHEALWLRAQTSPWYQGPAEEQIRPNRIRRDLLDRHRMVVYRAHSNWDAVAGDGVPDQAIAALGIAGLRPVAQQKFFKVWRLAEPMSVSALLETARKALAYGDCRAFGDLGKRITQFAFLIGGFGENQLHMPQAAVELGAEALILGETSEFIVVAALEMDLPVIETLHSVSESPGIRRQAELLAEKLPGLPVRYVPSGAPAFEGSAG